MILIAPANGALIASDWRRPMIKVCKGCGSTISPHARVCPTCGRPQVRLISKVAIVAGLAAAILFTATYIVPQYLGDDAALVTSDSADGR
jgi:uncharacterized OB-fold protein